MFTGFAFRVRVRVGLLRVFVCRISAYFPNWVHFPVFGERCRKRALFVRVCVCAYVCAVVQGGKGETFLKYFFCKKVKIYLHR